MGYLNVFVFVYFVGKVKDDDGKLKFKQRVKLEDIMVVNVLIGKIKFVFKNEDYDIRKLNELFYFLLLLRSIVNVFVSRDLDFLDKFDLCFCLLLCLCYEKYLKQCVEVVLFD